MHSWAIVLGGAVLAALADLATPSAATAQNCPITCFTIFGHRDDSGPTCPTGYQPFCWCEGAAPFWAEAKSTCVVAPAAAPPGESCAIPAANLSCPAAAVGSLAFPGCSISCPVGEHALCEGSNCDATNSTLVEPTCQCSSATADVAKMFLRRLHGRYAIIESVRGTDNFNI
jgi:hypothetical protein